ncbi:MAG: thiamine pyrophosphate-dependent dehydrogenase E1 component subunit alpha, partial [Luteimonas sp.]
MTVAATFEIEYLQYLGPDGKLIGEVPPAFRDAKTLLPLFKQMLFVRTFDTKAIALQRTGKLGTYAACLGHEATHVGIGASMRPEDVFAPSYREYGAQFMRGVLPREVLMYWGGDERGNDFSGPKHDYAWCVPIATQCLHAAGAALAFKLRKEPRVAVTCCGDGGSSKTDTYAAINSAGAYTLPFVQCIINNGWAISVPRKAQTGAKTLAQKGIAGGLHCLQVDGNDLIAVLEGMRRAMERARKGQGGSVIEFMTYRLHDHTTADDARRYRSEQEVKDAWTRDPMTRLRTYLTAQKLWDEAQETAWLEECGKRVDVEINAYLETP